MWKHEALLSHAGQMVKFYLSVTSTASQCHSYITGQGIKPRITHYSYDFAQQIHFPYSAQQTGPKYFKTTRKCGVFGLCNDGCNQQVNYLIDVAENMERVLIVSLV